MGFEAARGGPGFGAWHLTKAGRGGDTSRNVGSRRELPPRHTAGCGGSRPSGGNRADDCAARVLGPGSRWPWLGRSPPGRSAWSRLALRTVGRPCLCVGLGTGTHGRGGSVLERQVLERQVLEVTAQGNSIFCRTIPWKAALMILGLSKCERRTVLGRGAGTGSSQQSVDLNTLPLPRNQWRLELLSSVNVQTATGTPGLLSDPRGASPSSFWADTVL